MTFYEPRFAKASLGDDLTTYSRNGHLPTTFIDVKKVLLIILILATACSSEEIIEPLDENVLHQSFKTENGSETLKSLYEQNNQPMVVNLWATWCTPCLEEMPYFEAAHRKHGSKIQFIGINISDSPTRAKKRAEELHISYLLGNDPDGSFTKSLKAIGLPLTAFFNTEGKLSTIHQGPISEETLQESVMGLLDV
ncbi:MAG TPA: TlpA disulfide reductase family protein [Acidimicrobiales bacterium]|nr:TlpA disulfide reductase family protein [Acidimicrobiales bacterium]